MDQKTDRSITVKQWHSLSEDARTQWNTWVYKKVYKQKNDDLEDEWYNLPSMNDVEERLSDWDIKAIIELDKLTKK